MNLDERRKYLYKFIDKETGKVLSLTVNSRETAIQIAEIAKDTLVILERG